MIPLLEWEGIWDNTMKEYKWFVDNGVQLRFIKEPMINTNNEHDDVIKRAIQSIILTLTAFAEKEREEIKTRQAEGIAVAKAKGKHMGRPKTEITQEFERAYKQWKDKEITAVEAMKRANVPRSTFYRIVKEYEETLSPQHV
ncbi:recombinase family protein [Neobacillus cucumis]|uniref:recombinase family protein n=1 Tax=Neobacillus cucumis TaxID=1740721 RepID=UPI001EF82EE9|nr:recombinase family protein [Neobacillus cucumis]MBM7655311.1 DNA invertase Pin-like site-specific DNA recombinase [Neobacillus cucumis]